MRVLLLLAIAGLASAADEWYRVQVTVSTTSDWTVVRFDNAPRSWVDSQEVSSDRPVKVTTGPLAIHKPSMDETPTTLKAFVFLQLPESGDLELQVTRGDLGATTVSIQDLGEFSHAKVTGGGTNPKTFSVSAEAVRRLGPVRFEVKKPREKRVLAFYYPWYGSTEGPSKRWVHWNPSRHNDSTDTPDLGLYDSNDVAVIRQHVAWAREAGVDGFISSWWGRGTFEDAATRALLKVAEEEGFLVSVYLEQAEDAAQLMEDVSYLVKEFGTSKAWLKEDGRPVVFVYTRVVGEFRPAEFATARGAALLMMDTFDPAHGKAGGGLHTYNPVFEDIARLKETYVSASWACRVNGLVFAATVVPGYDDTVIREPGGKRGRDDGRLYDAFWEAALASEPDWVLVCSWNEWHEGSEIEPSKEYGDLYLKKTAEWARKWKGR